MEQSTCCQLQSLGCAYVCGEATIPMSPHSVEWVAIFPCLSFPDEVRRVLFGAFSIRHAGGFIVQVATWSMNHMPFDDIEQQGINVGIWKFGTDELVNVSGLYLLLQPNQHVSMRKPTLLPLNGIHPAVGVSEQKVLCDDINQL